MADAERRTDMKTTMKCYRLVALLAAVCLLCGTFAVIGGAAGRDANDILPAKFCSDLKAAIQNGEATFDASSYNIILTDEVREALADFVFEENPELFLAKAPISYSYSPSTGLLTKVTPTYGMTLAEYQAALTKVEAVADQLLYGIAGNKLLTDVEKALLVHDRLAIHCEYDTGVYTSAGPGKNARNIYGALVERKAVCDGYTRTYIYLLGKVGVKSRMIRSDRLNHSWNIVYIGGTPYHVDVTFDDPLNDVTGFVEHDNFLLSSSALYSRKHAASDYDTSPKDTRYDDYFWQDSHAAFLLASGKIYYIDSVNHSLNSYDGRKNLVKISGNWGGWHESDRGIDCFARLATDSVDLYYNTDSDVHRYTVASGKDETVVSLKESGKMIFGMVYENGKFIMDYTASLNDYNNGKASFRVEKAFAGATPTPKTLPGDVDGDGVLSSADARLALRASVKLENIKKGTAAFTAADADKNGKIESADARLILRASVKLEKLS